MKNGIFIQNKENLISLKSWYILTKSLNNPITS